MAVAIERREEFEATRGKEFLAERARAERSIERAGRILPFLVVRNTRLLSRLSLFISICSNRYVKPRRVISQPKLDLYL